MRCHRVGAICRARFWFRLTDLAGCRMQKKTNLASTFVRYETFCYFINRKMAAHPSALLHSRDGGTVQLLPQQRQHNLFSTQLQNKILIIKSNSWPSFLIQIADKRIGFRFWYYGLPKHCYMEGVRKNFVNRIFDAKGGKAPIGNMIHCRKFEERWF